MGSKSIVIYKGKGNKINKSTSMPFAAAPAAATHHRVPRRARPDRRKFSFFPFFLSFVQGTNCFKSELDMAKKRLTKNFPSLEFPYYPGGLYP
ncbi:hypothetical protein BDBG_17081 [Blastomyces gilchristii SLH14081]|uniref:Uncharacterized protein n=1 Tax=Blastomyces gilchristii (strain SLH14081) TaxID=559298 RepID=A0A179UQC8_BLAGS|nr:uncharacterized protein BDBG_17081 [Blastomyces gilchristii SLH14081]OAT08602.1 hypothetical protein BDBG_17081 [Blastomyces gilchristii SLH14081]